MSCIISLYHARLSINKIVSASSIPINVLSIGWDGIPPPPDPPVEALSTKNELGPWRLQTAWALMVLGFTVPRSNEKVVSEVVAFGRSVKILDTPSKSMFIWEIKCDELGLEWVTLTSIIVLPFSVRRVMLFILGTSAKTATDGKISIVTNRTCANLLPFKAHQSPPNLPTYFNLSIQG